MATNYSAKTAINPAQCRAARGLLNWSQDRLSQESGVPLRTLADFEVSARAPRSTTVSKLFAAFAKAGIAFISTGLGEGGVVLLPARRDLRSLAVAAKD